jgi:hypothetical protein
MINTQTITDVVVPATPLTAQAIEYARRSCEPYLFNHAIADDKLPSACAVALAVMGALRHQDCSRKIEDCLI